MRCKLFSASQAMKKWTLIFPLVSLRAVMWKLPELATEIAKRRRNHTHPEMSVQLDASAGENPI